MVLTKREREFVEDWLSVQRGEMERIDFFRKWGTKKDDEGFLDDYEKVQRGEMSVEEFRQKWIRKGEWKHYINVMRNRLKKKYRNRKKLVEQFREEMSLLNQFFSLRELPDFRSSVHSQ